MMPHDNASSVRAIIEQHLAECPDGNYQEGWARVFYQHRRSALQRLAHDRRAHVAISTITKTAGILDLVVFCLDAEWGMTIFPNVLSEEREMVERLRKHRESLADLKAFTCGIAKHPEHPGVGWRPITAAEEKVFCDTFKRIAELIEQRRETAEIALFDIGVTRKSGTTSAAATAAIGELAQHVAMTFGKPFASQVAALASVVFDIGEVSENRVRQCSKARNRRYTKVVRSPR